jgi:hypothetical protein
MSLGLSLLCSLSIAVALLMANATQATAIMATVHPHALNRKETLCKTGATAKARPVQADAYPKTAQTMSALPMLNYPSIQCVQAMINVHLATAT